MMEGFLSSYRVSKLPIRDSSTGMGPLKLLEERFLKMKRKDEQNHQNHQCAHHSYENSLTNMHIGILQNVENAQLQE